MGNNNFNNLTQKAKEIGEIYQEYQDKIGKLQRKQISLIKDFVKIVEARKIEEIRKNIGKK